MKLQEEQVTTALKQIRMNGKFMSRPVSHSCLCAAGMFCVMMLASCSDEVYEDDNDGAKVAMEFSASTEATRTVLESTGSVSWEAGDAISLFDPSGNNNMFTTSHGGESVIFRGAAVSADGKYYALYPYDADAELSGTVFTTVLPAQQSAREGSFSSMLNPSVAVADGADNSLEFKNTCAVVKFSFEVTASDEISKVVFSGNNGETLAGSLQIDAYSPSAAVLADGASSEIELSGTLISGTDYYFVVGPCSLENGFTITFYNSEGKAWSRVGTNPASLKSGHILDLGKIIVGNFSSCELIDGIYHIYDADGLKEWASKQDVLTSSVIIENDIDMTEDWKPVGAGLDTGFSGDFDGNNKTVSNLHIDETSIGNVGFFAGLSQSAKVHDVTFSGAVVEGGSSSYSGVVAGASLGIIENCRVNTSSVSGNYAGALVGNNSRQVNNCNVSNVEIDASYSGGGIAGVSYGKIEYCTVSGSDTKIIASGLSASAGGIVGQTSQESHISTSGRLLKCAVDGITVSGSWAGGIAGENGFGVLAQCVVTRTSIVHAANTASCRIGGVVGYNSRGDIIASYSANSTVGEEGLASEAIGGIVGYNFNSEANVYGCYSTNVSLLGNATESGKGAIAGYNSSGHVISCYAVLPQGVTGITLIGKGTAAEHSVEVGESDYYSLINDVDEIKCEDGTVWNAGQIWNLTASGYPTINAGYVVEEPAE